MAHRLLVSATEVVMRNFRLTRRQLAFLISTRAALAAGIGVLVSGVLSTRLRRVLGLGLVVLGTGTTIPAVRIFRSAH
jgi:hypothetical protein